jgi:mannose-6-phosphate isomerase
MEQNENNVFRLQGKIQHYAWGGQLFLPRLLSIPNPEGKPFAEYWLGAHDSAPSELVFAPASLEELAPASIGNLHWTLSVKLNDYIKAWPEATLGTYTAHRFGRLPYLLKILDVKDMLSIQVHPSKKEAEKEFEAENKKGVAPDAPDRNYKDDNHKPELMVALSEFWLLHGFKPAGELKCILQNIPELQFLIPDFEQQGYQGLYKNVMEMEQARVNSVLQPLLDRIIPAYEKNGLPKKDENFWAARAALTFNGPGKIDRGIFSIYLFNLVNLHPGEGIFQGAGLPHAYLEGQNVEIMANSDNVLRGGLTPKHIDVQELMKHVKFEETLPRVILGKNTGGPVSTFLTPAPDFELSKIELSKGQMTTINAESAEIYIVLEGEVAVEEQPQNAFNRKKGEAFIAFNGARLGLKAWENTILYRGAVPLGK